MTQKINKIYKINLEKVVWGSVNKKTLVVKIPTAVFELSDVGLDIWKMLIKNYGSSKIQKNLIKKYHASKKQIQIVFARFIKQLKDNEIIDEIR